jgi:outer membrane protein TolC
MKQYKRTTRVLLLIAILVVPAVGAVAEPIDVETAVALALDSNLGIETELIAVRQKKLIADTWWNRFYPSISARGTLARTNLEQSFTSFDPATFEPVESDRPRWSLSAGLDFSLVLTLQTIPGFSLAQLDYEAGLIDLSEARARIERDVPKQFYELLVLRERIALTEEQIANAERRYEQAQINFDNGLIDEFTLLSAQVQVENLRPALSGLQVQYQQALLSFKNDIGLPFTTEVEPVGTVDPPPISITYDKVDRDELRNRYDIQQLEQYGLLLEAQRQAADLSPQTGRAPFIQFGWSLDPAFSGDPWEDDVFDLDSWEQQAGAFTISIVQPIDPWLPYSATRNTISDFESQIARNRITIEQTLRGAEIGVRGLILAIRTSQETIRALEENIRLARRAYELAEIGYENGLRELLEVESAEVDLNDAELQLLEERANILTNMLDLAYELGTDLDTLSGR